MLSGRGEIAGTTTTAERLARAMGQISLSTILFGLRNDYNCRQALSFLPSPGPLLQATTTMQHHAEIIDGHYRVVLGGDLRDMDFTPDDRKALDEIVKTIDREEITDVSIDFAAVTSVDSAGLGFLLEVRQACNSKSANLVIRNLKPEVQETFGIARFDEVFDLQ